MTKKAKKTKGSKASDTVPARDALEKIMAGPLTFRAMIRSIREGNELSLDAFARKLGITRSHLCDVEQGRKVVSAERAAKWAKTLGYPESIFVQLVLQSIVDQAGIKLQVDVQAA